MELRLGSYAFSIGDSVIYVVDADADAVPEAAQIAEMPPDPQLLARVHARYPGLIIAVAAPTPELASACTEAGAALLVGDHLAAVAAGSGAGLVSSDPVRAISQGVRPDGILVEARTVGDAESLVEAGHAVLVTPGSTSAANGGTGLSAREVPDDPAVITPDAATLATVAVYCWTGAQVFRVTARDATTTRETLNMIASIKGTRPPSVSRRGLV